MKTKNNVQKTILRSIAVVVSFVLISITVSAQDFWKKLLESSSFNEIALAMVEISSEKTDSEARSENFNYANVVTESEPSLEMEDWMSDESYFGVTGLQITTETEGSLEMEDWMLDEEVFQVDENIELPLEVESWMTSEKVWEM